MNPGFSALVAGLAACAVGQPAWAANASKYRETVLYSFCSQANCTDGSQTVAGLVDVKGTLYGTTQLGGSENGGTVFALNPETDAERVLYSFCQQQNCADGQIPDDALLDVKGKLYGTTSYGGTNCGYRGGGEPSGCGTVFSLDPNTATEKVVYSFGGTADDGTNPVAGLVDMKGTLYSTAPYGGAYGYGTVFAVDRKMGTETTLYSFCSQQNCADGQGPIAGLIDANGTLYGTTTGGGVMTGPCGAGCGTVFSLNPNTGAETVLYAFCQQQNCTDGQGPNAGVINVSGILYGTTNAGGKYNYGTVFSLDPSTGAESVLHSFGKRADGTRPDASLIDVNGTLYGTTSEGSGFGCGGSGCGTVYALNPSTGAESVIYSFCQQKNCSDGASPFGSLIHVNGTFYGTTDTGGSYGGGTVFALTKQRRTNNRTALKSVGRAFEQLPDSFRKR